MDLFSRFKLWYQTQPPAIRSLLTINVVLYLAWNLLFVYVGPAHGFVYNWLALTPVAENLLLKPWQLVTYNFLHTGPGLGGLLHVLFNMLWLVWIGRDHEHMRGSADLMGLYLLGGIGGGLMSILLHTIFPTVGAFGGPIVGASASVLAIMAAAATLYPEKSIGLLFIGVIPLRVVVIGFLFLDLLFFSSTTSAVGAHLGGAVGGYLIARAQRNGRNVTGWASVFFDGGRGRSRAGRSARRDPVLGRLEHWLEQRKLQRDTPSGTARIHRLDPAADPEPAEPSSGDEVVDRLLDKINEHGYESLTDEEKRILYEASK